MKFCVLTYIRVASMFTLLSFLTSASVNAATEPQWSEASTGFSNSSVDTGCGGACHDLAANSSMRLSGPTNVPADATTASVQLNGITASSYSWRYRVRGVSSSIGTFTREGGLSPSIDIGTGSGDVDVDYCIAQNPGNTRTFNCGTLSINRLDPPNNSPSITSGTLPDLQLLTTDNNQDVSISATDTDGDTIEYSSSRTGSAVNVSGGGSVGNFSVEPVSAGVSVVTLTASDGEDTDSRSFTVTVSEPEVVENSPPEISPASLPDLALLTTDDDQDVSISATDADGDTIEYSSTRTGSAVNVTGGGSVGSFSVEPVSVGVSVVTLTASDGEDSESRSFTVTVSAETGGGGNTPPVVSPTSLPDLTFVTTGDAQTVSITATDTDNDALSYSSNETGGVVSVVGANGTYAVSPLAVGTGTVTIGVTDGVNDAVTRTFDVVVNEPEQGNNPPRFTLPSLPDINISIEAGSITIVIGATDEDNDVLTFTATSSTDVVTITGDAATGEFTFQPSRVGSTVITITVSDGMATASLSFTVVVSAPTDNPPTIEEIEPGSLSLVVGSSNNLQVVASDDNPGLVYQSRSNDAGIATVENLGGGSFRVTGQSQGSTEIILTVVDSTSQAVERSVGVQVSASNQPPNANDDRFVITDLTVSQMLNVLDNDDDPDGDTLSIQLDSSQSTLGGAISVSGGQVSYTPAVNFNSEDSFTYRASDPDGLSASATVTLTQSDADGDGVFDSADNCLVLANPDQLDMDTDGLGDLCDSDPDGDGLPGISGENFDSGRALVEAECLVCHNDESTGAPLFNDTTAWDARIAAAGGIENLVASVSNGLGTMPAFGSRFTAKELTEAVRYLSGQEGDTSVAIGDRDLDQILDGDDNCPGIANTDQSDNDGNGVGDLCEPLADNDGDGYPLSLDDDDSNGVRLPARSGAASGTSYFLGEGALSLGRHARELARQNGFTSASVTIRDSEFPAVASALDSGVTHSADSRISTTIGIISLDIASQGGTAALRIQLVSALPLNPVFRVYEPSSGIWSDFSMNSSDSVASAQAVQGECPAIESLNYSNVLQSGANCVRITIQDGGVNDSDGTADGKVALLANLGESVNDNGSGGGNGSGGNDVDTSPSKSGGGAFSLITLFFMVLVGCMKTAFRRKMTVHFS